MQKKVWRSQDDNTETIPIIVGASGTMPLSIKGNLIKIFKDLKGETVRAWDGLHFPENFIDSIIDIRGIILKEWGRKTWNTDNTPSLILTPRSKGKSNHINKVRYKLSLSSPPSPSFFGYHFGLYIIYNLSKILCQLNESFFYFFLGGEGGFKLK